VGSSGRLPALRELRDSLGQLRAGDGTGADGAGQPPVCPLKVQIRFGCVAGFGSFFFAWLAPPPLPRPAALPPFEAGSGAGGGAAAATASGFLCVANHPAMTASKATTTPMKPSILPQTVQPFSLRGLTACPTDLRGSDRSLLWLRIFSRGARLRGVELSSGAGVCAAGAGLCSSSRRPCGRHQLSMWTSRPRRRTRRSGTMICPCAGGATPCARTVGPRWPRS